MYEKKQKEEAARLEVFNREQAIELQEKNDKNELRRRRVKANKAAIEAGRYTS
jgi:anti-sigma28 factor (negative regulator of flagellin synthesis)